MPLVSSNELATTRLRRMEDEFDSREDLSEDDSPPTDASEDSVEVRVTPITRPQKSSYSTTLLPHKFRKALTQRHLSSTHRSPSPPRTSVPSPSSANYPEEPPVSPSQRGDNSTSSTTNQAFPPAPISPGASAPARANRRKATEPRKFCADQDVRVKRSYQDDSEASRPSKLARVYEKNEKPEMLQPHASFLSPGALMAPLIPAGGFPHLLIPPWPQVARHPYARLAGNVMAPPFGLLPGSLPPPPYPLIPIVPATPGHHLAAAAAHMASKPPPFSLQQPSESSTFLLTQHDSPLVLKESKVPSHSNRDKIYDDPQPTKSSSSPLTIPPTPPRGEPSRLSSPPAPKPHKSSSKFLSVESLLSSDPPVSDVLVKQEQSDQQSGEENIQSLLHQPKQKQRNYKNMTRERRIEANARERTRVHTISAAFEKLRRTVPSYSHNQKLSKLSVLRIACSYILSLSRLSGRDYSLGETSPSFEECVDLTTRTIQVEGKAKKKREDS